MGTPQGTQGGTYPPRTGLALTLTLPHSSAGLQIPRFLLACKIWWHHTASSWHHRSHPGKWKSPRHAISLAQGALLDTPPCQQPLLMSPFPSALCLWGPQRCPSLLPWPQQRGTEGLKKKQPESFQHQKERFKKESTLGSS